MALFYVDGEYVDEKDAFLPVTDLGLLRGYAVFDFLRTYNGRPFHLKDHINRLRNSAELLSIQFPWLFEDITRVVHNLLIRNNFPETNIRFVITGGDSIDSITPTDVPRLLIMATELKSFPREWYTNGVKIITSNVTRYIPGSKSTNYIQAILSLRQAKTQGAIESIYVTEKGELLEGTTSNLFAVKDGTVLTPENNILPGITRQVVIALLKDSVPCSYGTISRDSMNDYSEMFITSSNKEVVPVVQVDEVMIGDRPGPVTEKVINLFGEYSKSW